MGIHLMPPLYKVVMPTKYVLVVSPDAHPEVKTVDGQTVASGTYTSWAALQAAVGTNAYPSVTSLSITIISRSLTNQWAVLIRSPLLFDTSPLPLGAVIGLTTLSLYGTDVLNQYSSAFAMGVFGSDPLSDTDLVAADHTRYGEDLLSDVIADSAWVVNGWNTLTLKSAGKSAIVKGGITKLAIREANFDAPNIELPWQSNKLFHMNCVSADGLAALKPYLTINYDI